MAATLAKPGPKTEKPWRHAIQRAVKEFIEVEVNGKPKKIRALNALARKMVKKGLAGDVSALREIGDRLDGRPAQAIDVGVQVKITAIERQIVEPRAIEGPVIDGVAVEASEAIESNGKTITSAKD